LFKVRVTYGRELESIDVDPYLRRPVQQVELVAADGLDYRFKYADRRNLDALRHNLAIGCQPLIVQHGQITDATYANVCLFDGERWLTPEKPLLQGTARTAALAAGQVLPAAITAQDFRGGKYSKMKLINCMALFSEAQEILL
jgi:4-amino-4-deoxychorismate lyase